MTRFIRFDVLMAVNMKIRPRGLSDGYRGSQETGRQHIHVERVKITSTLKMEPAFSRELLVPLHHAAWRFVT